MIESTRDVFEKLKPYLGFSTQQSDQRHTDYLPKSTVILRISTRCFHKAVITVVRHNVSLMQKESPVEYVGICVNPNLTNFAYLEMDAPFKGIIEVIPATPIELLGNGFDLEANKELT